MATSSCYPVTFMDVYKRDFIFSVDKTALFDDKFTQSKCIIHRLHSSKDKILLLNSDGEFQAQMLSKPEQEQAECTFNIQIFDNVTNASKDKRKETPVMIYVNKDGKKLVAFCSSGDEVHPKEMDIPWKIEESSHEALFYLTKLQGSSKFMLESSVYPSKYLAFQSVEDDVTLDKLILREKGYDEADESCEIIPK